MKVVLFGGAGYIGSVLAPALLQAGHEVTVLDRLYFGDTLAEAKRAFGDRLQVIRADIRTFDPAILQGKEAAVDLSGISNDPACELSPDLTRSVNVEGGKRLIRLTREAGVRRYVYSSSCSLYGRGEGPGLTEGSPRRPVSLYARTKAEVEDALFAAGGASGGSFEVTALRLATVFGLSPRMRFDLAVNVMTRNAYVNRRITVDGGGKQWRPFVHVRDVSAAFQAALEAEASLVNGKVFNIGSSAGNMQIASLAFRVRDAIPGTEIVHVPTDPDLRDYNVSFATARDVLGVEAQLTIDDGIREVHDALRSGELDPDDRRFYTMRQYAFLREAERAFEELAIDGHLLTSRGSHGAEPADGSRLAGAPADADGG